MDAGAVTETRDAASPRMRTALWLLSLLVAITRWPALSKTLWDWDEALFCLALRDYDVTRHHPHPPGFPLFIAAAKLIPLDPFHALQLVTALSSLFVLPAMYFLARELGASRFVGLSSGLLLAFFPNVWFFGGTAFSDVPSMVLGLLACALLLRGRTSDVSLLAGCVVLGIAAGFRPQNLVIGCVPALLAAVRRPRTAFLGAMAGAGIIAASYGTAAHLSGGWSAYRAAIARHEEYIRTVDSFLAPLRPNLVQVADDFFFWPYRAVWINGAIVALAIAGVLRRRALLVLAIYGPFMLFAWLYLDFHSASRFSVAYMPLYALLAAEGLPRKRGSVVLGALILAMIIWTWPALRTVHTTASPPVAAIEALPHGVVVYVDRRLGAHADLLTQGVETREAGSAPPVVAGRDAVLLREGASTARGARSFVREGERLRMIARPRYFETSIVPARNADVRGNLVRFPTGLRSGALTIALTSRTPCVLWLDGRVLERVDAGKALKTWSATAPRELRIEGDAKLEWLEFVPQGTN